MLIDVAMFLAIGALALGPSAPAPEGTAPATAHPVDAAAPRPHDIVIRGPKGEALICKKYQPPGSRLPIRACRTAYDWAELNAASLRNLDQMIGKGTYP